MLDAIEIAKYTVSYCAKLGNPISNLKLQKMLYYLWVEFYKQTGEYLFFNRICAWKLGPVVPDTYYEFCPYGGSPINRIYNDTIATSLSNCLNPLIDTILPVSASELVNMTHRNGTPWKIVFGDGAGDRHPIPFELIRSVEC